MRIAFVINTSWNIYNFRRGLIEALRAQGHEVYAVAPEDTYSSRLEEELGCTYVPLLMDAKGTNPVQDLLLIGRLCRIYRRISPDVVLHYTIKPNIYGSLAARWLGIPAINNVSGLGTTFIRENGISRLVRWLYRQAFQSPRKVFFQNADDLELFISKGLVSSARGEVVPGSGIDLNRFKETGNTDNEYFTFLLTGRMLYDKGIVEFADAARWLQREMPSSKLRFQVLGFIEEQNNLGIPEKTIRAWEEEGVLEYLGTSDRVEDYLAHADCVVLPSYREGLPKSLVEAAAMGKPLIATDVPGCREVVQEGENGYLCRARDAAHLGSCMKKMVSLPEDECMMMGRKSRELAEEKFDQQVVIDRYLNHINALKSNKEKV